MEKFALNSIRTVDKNQRGRIFKEDKL